VAAKQMWKMEAGRNVTKNRRIVNKRAERRIFQAEAVVRGRKEKFSARALG
jgi:hypothetical protein